MNTKSLFTRRSFAASALGMAASLSLPRRSWANLNSRPTVLCVGVGGKGQSGLSSALNMSDVIGICDVDAKQLEKASGKAPAARKFADFREMFTVLGSKADGVVISTPDHSHYPAAMAALKLRKDIFVEKPLTNTMWESEQMLIGASITGVVTQMGNQGRLYNSRHLVRKWVKEGLIGDITEVHVWTNRPIWPQGSAFKFERAEPPAELNWLLWLGSVPDQDYVEGIVPFKWRALVDFGSGAMDMGEHLLDVPLFALDPGPPTSVTPDLTDTEPRVYPASSHLTYRFSKRQNLVLQWYDGGKKPVLPEVIRKERVASGGYFMVGTDGYIFDYASYGETPAVVSRSGKILRTDVPEKNGSAGMVENWLEALVKRSKPVSPWEEGAPLTEVCLVGNLAAASNRTIHWDAAARTTGDLTADRLLKRTYRSGWEVSAADL